MVVILHWIDEISLAIHWEDALNGTVYISIVERFSEIVLYDDKGVFYNTSAEMRRISSARLITRNVCALSCCRSTRAA